jgi:hypothetical protein
MATFDDLRDSIRAVADNRGIPGSVGLRTPSNDTVEYKDQELTVGTAWGEDKSFEILTQGIADYLDTLGLGEVGTIKTKLNELIGEYNQLREDYLTEGLTTTAAEVDPVP